MSSNRANWRNVSFYEASTGDLIGGTHQCGSLTEANLISILGRILLVVDVDDGWTVKYRNSGCTIEPVTTPLQLGAYDIYSSSPLRVNNEPWIARVLTRSASGREDAFRNGVRARDGKCVITGVVNVRAPQSWLAFHSAHVFPISAENLWIESGYGRWVTDNGKPHFTNYFFSINPDDGYKITCFTPDVLGLDGRTLDPVCRDPADPHHVSDEILRWHYRQAVLANMRGAGEPMFEHDFPPGTGMLAEMRAEPYGKMQFEVELSSRLGYSAGQEATQ